MHVGWKVRGIRGAITVDANDKGKILQATRELFREMVQRNRVSPDDVACIYITVTQDLTAAFPAPAIREETGWSLVPLMCANEMDVTGSLPRCIRLLMLVNTNQSQADVRHVYLRDAARLRPDLVN